MINLINEYSPPELLITLEDLNIKTLPPWNIIKESFQSWKKQFDNVNLSHYIPFARMVNDDVIACFKQGSKEVFLFNLPLYDKVGYFKSFTDMESWLKYALDDMYNYIVNY